MKYLEKFDTTRTMKEMVYGLLFSHMLVFCATALAYMF